MFLKYNNNKSLYFKHSILRISSVNIFDKDVTVLNFQDPLEQFQTFKFLTNDLFSFFDPSNFSNTIAFQSTLILLTFTWIIFLGNYNVWNFLIDSLAQLVKTILKGNTPLVRYQYYTAIVVLFVSIISSNAIGLIPYTFTITSSFIVTFFFALTHYLAINLIGVNLHNWKIMSIFLPGGVPLIITTALIIIETISYIAKVLSLSIRLFANMMSGHALLKILSGFCWNMLKSGNFLIFAAILPWAIVTIILHLELLIAFLQAYVFTILISIYISDVLVISH